jgi:dolichol-phosphate mannosyltransferase
VSWLVVTPARNEAAHLPRLAASLAAQDAPEAVGLWVIVDDASTDGTGTAVDPATMPFPTMVVRRPPGTQGLRNGGAFGAFFAGADAGLERLSGARRVMKLDADVVLDPSYFRTLRASDDGTAGLIGGVIGGRGEREQSHHVRGPLKAYSRDAFSIVRALPAAVGHDVVDEVALRRAGMTILSIPEARASVQRRTGVSEGTIAGRVRNGEVSRITGYHPAYFALRLLRYLFRRPVLVGSLAMVVGWARAGESPFPEDVLAAHRHQQSERLRRLARQPVTYLREAFS